MENYVNGPEVPMGFGMALAQNIRAMEYFVAQDDSIKKEIIKRTAAINSKEEMRRFVDDLPGKNFSQE